MPHRIIVTTPDWFISGANVAVATLLSQLSRGGHRCTLLITERTAPRDLSGELPPGISVEYLPFDPEDTLRERQKRLIAFLRAAAPCIYLPNFDFALAAASPELPNNVVTVGIVHCDEPIYYEFVAAVGSSWNATVCVSRYLHRKLTVMHPELSRRLVHIPFGLQAPAAPTRSSPPGEPLRVVFCGRITQYQKRVFDLAAVIEECRRKHVPVRFSIVGAGADEAEFRRRIEGSLQAGTAELLGSVPNAGVQALLTRMDALILTSEFEGLPIVLLEAMAAGCVPVISHTNSGVDELVENGRNGFLVPIGRTEQFVARIDELARDPARRAALSAAAYATLKSGPYSLEESARRYLDVFDRCVADVRCGIYRRPQGKRYIPPNQRLLHRLLRKAVSLLVPARAAKA